MDGPLKSILKTFFTYEGIKEWLAKYWFVISTCTLLLVSFMLAFIYSCARYTPSSNPEKEYKKPTKALPGRKPKRRQGPPPRSSAAMPMM